MKTLENEKICWFTPRESRAFIDEVEIITRMPNREFSTAKKRITLMIAFLVVLLIGYILSLEIATFQTAQSQRVAQFHYLTYTHDGRHKN